MFVIKKLVIIILSALFSILIINFVLLFFFSQYKPYFLHILVEAASFSPKYIYWGNPYCTENCADNWESKLTHKTVFFNQNEQPCFKIIAIGDSYTDSPWDDDGYPYIYHFGKKYAEDNNTCVQVSRLATSGTGSDQQFARFSDVIEDIEVDLVVWQFYANDMTDNVVYSLFNNDSGNLKRNYAYANFTFISGFLNQKIPFLSGTALGDFLLYIGENIDVFNTWEVAYNFEAETALNKFKIDSFLEIMNNFSIEHEFDYITTLSPLECELLEYEMCDMSLSHTELLTILKDSETYVSQFNILNGKHNYFNQFDLTLQESDFWKEEKDISLGYRHLGASGQMKVGSILYINYLKSLDSSF